MVTYPYIEDYLELLGGYSPNNWLQPTPLSSPISLARYDVAIVVSMAENTLFGIALTDKQGALAINLVLKYQRQFANLGVDVTPANNPVFRLPLRTINRERKIWKETDSINIQFPFTTNLVEDTRAFKKISCGRFDYDSITKVWSSGITEANISWIVAWGQANRFTIDNEVMELFNLILQCELIPYSIKLVKNESEFSITNATDNLITYINNHCGGFGPENIVSLVDNAVSLVYEVDETIISQVVTQHGENINLFPSRNIHLTRTIENFARIIDYAELTNRFPIYVYDPSSYFYRSELKTLLETCFSTDTTLTIPPSGKIKDCDIDLTNVKLIYATKIPTGWEHKIPLLLTTQELLFGGVRQEWAVRAERIVNYCDTKLKE